jgi:hypothetical protein
MPSTSARDRQADARTFDACALHAEPIEGLEQVRELIGPHATAGVAHAQAHRLCACPLAGCVGCAGRCSRLDHDLPAAPVVFDRARQQVQQHLAQAGRVGVHAACERTAVQAHAVGGREPAYQR